MKRFITYILLFISGLLIGLFFLWKERKSFQSEQLDIIHNGIKNVQKLIVTEASYTEIYNYQDADKYLFETIAFEKKIILFVEAKVQVAYDLQKMKIHVDSLHKTLIIKSIPKEEISIIPTYKYYDLQQSMWNTFTKDDLNKIQQQSLDKLIDNVALSKIKQRAQEQLRETLTNLFSITQLAGWKIEDRTQNHVLQKNFLKDIDL